MTSHDHRGPSGGVLRRLLTVVVCAALLGGAAATSMLIFASEPEAQTETATRRSAAPVETVVVERGRYAPRLEVLGRVTAAHDVVLGPRVAGHVERLEPGFAPGGFVRAGQALLHLDPTDFERALSTRQAELRQVEAELEIEQGRQIVAREEFELLGEEIASANRSLVLREPQIAAVRARIQGAEAAVERARLDLERTTVRAPFDAQVLDRPVDVGAQVGPGDTLARLVGVEEAWVLASVPLRDLHWLDIPREGEAGPRVELRHATAWPPGVVREGEVSRLLGAVDQQTRLARVLVTVPDPLGLELDGPPLILGTIVQLAVECRALEDVVRLDRRLVRQGDTVWIFEDGVLRIRPVEIAYRDARHAFVRAGLEAGEELVATDLATVADGLALRRVDGDASDAGEVIAPAERVR